MVYVLAHDKAIGPLKNFATKSVKFFKILQTLNMPPAIDQNYSQQFFSV